MTRAMTRPGDHPDIPAPKIGVLLVNLGTPDAPEPKAVKRYLREFLSDRRVVEIPPLVWQPILRGIILNTRPKKSAHAYRQVWMAEGSPLAVYHAAAGGGAGGRVRTGGDRRSCDALRQPGHRRAARRAAGAGLHAHPGGAALSAILRRRRRRPWWTRCSAIWGKSAGSRRCGRCRPIMTIRPISTRSPRSLRASLAALDFEPEALIASFHGMPRRTLELGDPYHCHCRKTARLLAEALGRPLEVAFQSRFGRAKWLEPATDKVLAALPGQGKRKVAIFAPGFSVDCLETLEELAIRGRETFMAAGGTDFACLPCLNDSADGMAMLRILLARELEGWRPAD